MSELTFRLEAFEGPLDLLLHFITKHKLNIYDIEISLLLDQYLEYIDSLDEQDFDAAGDFLAMAARLVYIKTCSLLPQAEEAEEMKKELQGELIEYSVCKEAAARLRRECVYGNVFVRPPEKIPVNMTFTGTMPARALVDAYMGMTAKARSMKPVRAEQFSPIVAARIVTVTSKIVYVLKKLYKVGECTVEELYHNVTDKSARVATFLAVLELAKSGRIYLNEDNTLICFNKDTPRRHSNKQPFVDGMEVPAAAQDDVPVSAQEDTEEASPEPEEAPDDTYPDDPGEPEYEDIQPEEYEEHEQEQVAVRSAKYALEPLNRTHSLAVPVYIEIPAEPEEANHPEPAAETQPAQPEQEQLTELSEVTEPAPQVIPEPEELRHPEPVDEIQPAQPEPEELSALPEVSEPVPQVISATEAADEEQPLTYIKENRFSVRCRWGCPAQTSNCWSYWRERI